MEILQECSEKMDKAITSYKSTLGTIRTGSISPMILDKIKINYYGEDTPIKNVASINVQSALQMIIRPFDPSALKLIVGAIGDSDLGINPIVDGNQIRLNFPPLSGDRRDEFCKLAKKYSEDAKVAVRNIRRDMNELVKKDKTLRKDMSQDMMNDIQKETDKHIKLIDEILAAKEKEIKTV